MVKLARLLPGRLGPSWSGTAAGGSYCRMISVADEDQDPSFKVSDRRRFSSEGQPLEENEATQAEAAGEPQPESPEPAAPEPAAPQTQAAQSETPQADPSTEPPASEPQASASPGSPPLPPATFELLIVSLAIQAQMQLGGDGVPEGRPPDLEVARHSIDLLDVLKTKTQGNLTIEESRLLDNTLTELRFRYIQRVEEINKAAKA